MMQILGVLMLLISPVFKDEKKWDVKKQKNEPAPKGG
jgi:hypothetical protein